MSAVARLMAYLGMDASSFNKEVDNAQKKTSGFSSMLSGMKGKIAAAFTVGAAIKAGKDAIEMGDQISEMASNLNVTTDELQALSFMFKTTGSSVETFERAMNKINAAIGDAQNGSKDATEKLTKFGMTLDDIDAGNPAKALELMAKYLKENQFSTSALADVFDVTGEKSRNLKNGLMELSEKGLAGVIKSSADAGRILTEQEIANLGKAQDKLDAAIDWAKKKAAKAVGVAAKVASGGDARKAEDDKSGAEARRRVDEKTAAKIDLETAEIKKKTAFDALSAEEQLTSLKEEQLAIEQKISQAKTLTEKAELGKQSAELEDKIQRMERGKQAPSMSYDQLVRIGAGVFRGGASDVVPKNQLKELQKISLALNRIENTKMPIGVFK